MTNENVKVGLTIELREDQDYCGSYIYVKLLFNGEVISTSDKVYLIYFND